MYITYYMRVVMCVRMDIVLQTSMSSKIIGVDSSFFADICVKAANLAKKTMSDGKVKYLINNINVVKCHGKSSLEVGVISVWAVDVVEKHDVRGVCHDSL